MAIAVGYDAWYRSTLIVRERERVRANMEPHAQALDNAIQRRLLRPPALKSFVEAQPSQEALLRTFSTYAAGLRIAAPGIRALQLIKNGRIIATERIDGALVIGYNLLSDPRAEIVNDVRRAMALDGVVIGDPVELMQGGQGLGAWLRLTRVPSSFPDLVAMVVELQPLLD